MLRLVQDLPEGPLDIIGDVHGEASALRRLLTRLGCDPDKGVSERPLVFVGDLVDRGPDSPAVLELVMRLVEAGIAQCVLGNHEYNILTNAKKEGNGWIRRDETDGFQLRHQGQVVRTAFGSANATKANAERYRQFFAELPLALVRDDLRIVHACWRTETIRSLPEYGDVIGVGQAIASRIYNEQVADGLSILEREERQRFADLKDLTVVPDQPLPHHVKATLQRQNGNGVRVITSGLEEPVDFKDIFFVGGKWRFVRRAAWWQNYDEHPAVVVGHYWRQRSGAELRLTGGSWNRISPFDWAGPRRNVFCVDYSVGRRYQERATGRHTCFEHGLAALRWPERVLVFDDREGFTPTNFDGHG